MGETEISQRPKLAALKNLPVNFASKDRPNGSIRRLTEDRARSHRDQSCGTLVPRPNS